MLPLKKKYKERIQRLKETGNSRYIYQNEQDKACFQHDMVHGIFKDFPRWSAHEEVLRYRVFDIDKNSKYGGCQKDPA